MSLKFEVLPHLLLIFIMAIGNGQLSATIDVSPLDETPVSYEGRFRPMRTSSTTPLISSASADEADFEAYFSFLSEQGLSAKQIEQRLEAQYPIAKRIETSSPRVLALPGKKDPSRWLPLSALKIRVYSSKANRLIPIQNFTTYNDETFEKIRFAYLALEKAIITDRDNGEASDLAKTLNEAYTSLQGKVFRLNSGKQLSFPTLFQLKLENFYYNFPFSNFAITAYLLAAASILAGLYYDKKNIAITGYIFLALAFLIHTACLALRCTILMRPPVSNMYETLLFVPWITVAASIALYFFYRSKILLVTASLSSALLLIIMAWSRLNDSLDNVQPVLDSQYWLIIHVLMVVGSYGLFILAGVLAHLYLISTLFKKITDNYLNTLSSIILSSMYLGVALLIPGTILGGVWAAESWGRFWDWDPKESWAFISSCTYLIWIHAYTFRKIGCFGLSVGAISGLMVISFTWYGVNYILGTGLHSYGFGSGGTGYFIGYMTAELIFLAFFVGKLYYERPPLDKTGA